MDNVDFIFQLGNLKRTKRSGWLSAGILNCESVAEHSFRTAIILYLLAKAEGFRKEKTNDAMLLALIHDVLEIFFQVKEYFDEGKKLVKEWFAPQKLKTKSAKLFYNKMIKRNSRKWIFGAIKW